MRIVQSILHHCSQDGTYILHRAVVLQLCLLRVRLSLSHCRHNLQNLDQKNKTKFGSF